MQLISRQYSSVIFALGANGLLFYGEPMSERLFLCDLIFKPLDPKLKLRPEESQLLLAYIGEILKEIEAEENAANAPEHPPCT